MKMYTNINRKTANILGLLFVLLSTVGILYLAFANVELQTLIAPISALNSPAYALIIFACLVLISQFLVIPSGSLLMIAGGFLLGSIPATLIYTALLPLTGIIVAGITESSSLKKWLDTLLAKHNKLSRLTELLKNEPFTLSMVLRLTPVIPSAIAAIAASSLKVRNHTFILATLCVGWVRPLFFASIGGAIQSLRELQDGPNLIAEKSLIPLSLLAVSAILNLLVRCWLRWKRESSAV